MKDASGTLVRSSAVVPISVKDRAPREIHDPALQKAKRALELRDCGRLAFQRAVWNWGPVPNVSFVFTFRFARLTSAT